MCGIMGYYCFGDKKPDKQKITKMFTLLESRGRDASGYAFIRDGNLIVNKLAQRSSITVKTYDWKNMDLPSIMLLHTRMKTQGTEKNNANNHPLFNKEGLCIVHNGIIHNDNEIFGKNQRDGDVDSEAILAVLSSKTKGDKVKLIDSGVASAEVVRQEINRIGLETNSHALGYQDFYVSDIPTTFKKVAELFLGQYILNVKKIDLEELQKK
ncbi:MAG: hypothetical protein M0Q21_09015 [Ignavibacteriaceae bacterium]|nr:hypothetical protein [Ignavibacteriaceae bacterium]